MAWHGSAQELRGGVSELLELTTALSKKMIASYRDGHPDR